MSQCSPVQVLLSRSAREDDVVVGTETAGRGPPELAGVVGCLANLLALRTDLSGPHPLACSPCSAAQLTRTHGLPRRARTAGGPVLARGPAAQ